jgi:hypothetical protein
MGCDIFIAGCQQHGSSHHYRGKESYFSLLHLERHDHDERPNLPHQPPGEASRWPWAPVREGAKRVSRNGAIMQTSLAGPAAAAEPYRSSRLKQGGSQKARGICIMYNTR